VFFGQEGARGGEPENTTSPLNPSALIYFSSSTACLAGRDIPAILLVTSLGTALGAKVLRW